MPEKQAKGFGQADTGETFSLKTDLTPAEGQKTDEKQIVLNISEAKNSKVLLRKSDRSLGYTGNVFIDTYRRVNNFFIDHTPIKTKERAIFFRLLAVMIGAGLPLIRSLKTLSLQSEKNPRLQKVLMQIAIGIENGRSFSESLSDYPDVFSEAQIGMVRAGEASGQLNKNLKSLAEELEKTASINGKVKGAMIYPIVILCLLVTAIFLMMIFVVPQVTKLFTQTGSELPLPTKILIWMSDVAVNYWYVVIFSVAVFIFAFVTWKKTRIGRYQWDYIKLNLPVFGVIIQKTALAKFSRGFSNQLKSGVPIIKSLEIVASAIGNEVYKRRLILTAEDMKRGIPMAENLTDTKLFPSMLVNMIEIGEQTAQLENTTEKVAEFYDEEVDNMIKSLTKIMEPFILVFIGVTVGGLVAAIMLPIIQLTSISSSL